MISMDNAERQNFVNIDKNRLTWKKLKVGDIVEYNVRIRKDERAPQKDRDRYKVMKIIFKSRNMIVGKSENYNNSYCFNDLVTRDINITKISKGNDLFE